MGKLSKHSVLVMLAVVSATFSSQLPAREFRKMNTAELRRECREAEKALEKLRGVSEQVAHYSKYPMGIGAIMTASGMALNDAPIDSLNLCGHIFSRVFGPITIASGAIPYTFAKLSELKKTDAERMDAARASAYHRECLKELQSRSRKSKGQNQSFRR